MQKIVEYHVVSADEVCTLNDWVNARMEDGWQPHGSLNSLVIEKASGNGHIKWFSQPMVKYEDKDAVTQL